MKDPQTDPIVEEPLTGEPIRKSILDKANGDPVAAARQRLSNALGMQAAALALADRYAAKRALAELKAAVDVFGLPSPWGPVFTDGQIAYLEARRDALEKEARGAQ